MMQKEAACYLRVSFGKSSGAFGFALIFFAPLFLSREKVENIQLPVGLKNKKTPTAMFSFHTLSRIMSEKHHHSL
jgi:hypothetical protein